MSPLTHTKIYGSGVKCLLEQAGITGTYEKGILRIEINEKQKLVVVATDDLVLHFFIESYKPEQCFPNFQLNNP